MSAPPPGAPPPSGTPPPPQGDPSQRNIQSDGQPDGPIEGGYDARLGAAAYAPIVSAFGALAVTAIAEVFTAASNTRPVYVAFATG
jgi:hypothetical protein